ncbi:gamma-aminobutyric acid type B receptor subunit 3 [Musca autumnalis]|uniref:gamma-aminobutyric acid type B receptor subunit 3 n=1 Tax=Musca autumnalis TaxID=221902 RepID=UPI003CF3BB2D
MVIMATAIIVPINMTRCNNTKLKTVTTATTTVTTTTTVMTQFVPSPRTSVATFEMSPSSSAKQFVNLTAINHSYFPFRREMQQQQTFKSIKFNESLALKGKKSPVIKEATSTPAIKKQYQHSEIIKNNRPVNKMNQKRVNNDESPPEAAAASLAVNAINKPRANTMLPPITVTTRHTKLHSNKIFNSKINDNHHLKSALQTSPTRKLKIATPTSSASFSSSLSSLYADKQIKRQRRFSKLRNSQTKAFPSSSTAKPNPMSPLPTPRTSIQHSNVSVRFVSATSQSSHASASSSSNLLPLSMSLWQQQQQQHYLKVNQVFEQERALTRNNLQHNRGKIVLLGLFELSTKSGPRPEGLSELIAAQMAVEHINRKQLLPGYTIELMTNDTQCDPGVGVDRFFHAIYTQPSTRMVMLLGSACSEVTESLAKVVPYWNIVQVSFGSTSPALSDRQEFPYFYRTVAPDSSHNPARIAFIRRFAWDTVTTFSQNEEIHSLAVNDLVTELEAANISCAATITFGATDYKEQLLLLRESDTRIIIGSFSPLLAPHILCEAYRLRMFGADYAWILHESMGAPWWHDLAATNSYCTAKELQAAVENLIIVSSHNSIVGNNISLSGLNNDMFYKQLRQQSEKFNDIFNIGPRGGVTTKLQPQSSQKRKYKKHVSIATNGGSGRGGSASHSPANKATTKIVTKQTNVGSGRSSKNNNDGHSQHLTASDATAAKDITSTFMLGKTIVSRYAPQTYDAVWAIALSLRAAEDRWRKDPMQHSKLDRFDYTRSDMATEFLQQMGKLDFLGVSGPVSFSGPDRIGTTAFYQIQNGQLEPIALYYPAENALDFRCPHCKRVKWHGGQVPIAKRVFKVRVATIAPMAFYTIATLSSVGIAMALAFLAFNLHFRKLKAIKLSSPKLSNITAVGCIFVYTAVILLGLDYSTLPSPEDTFATVCTARVYLLSAGFSLAFGSMFAKTYRVHRIFTRTGSVFKDKMLQDIQLILLVCGLLLVDGLVVTLWVVTDPMERHLHNLTLEISNIDRSVVYQPQVEVCRSQHTQTWLGALYSYKGLLLVVGVYMAWETRHVKIPALNDSQYIGVSVYSVVITSGIVVVLANLISERVTLAFITITALILTSTTATLCLLFIPKLHDIWARNDVVDPVISSMGLKMECNTRRFVLDDRRELQYRVEVQNRVYKKEIASLDAEIRKLERMLESGTASTTTSSSASIFAALKPEVTITSDTSSHLPAPSHGGKSRTPSISGILPNLLLSVLPPVIPRASWPSAEYMQIPMRKSVTFASQPHLEDRTIAGSCLPAQDLLNLRLAHQHATETKTGIINRIRGIFTRTQSSNKGSIASLADQKGIKAALMTHVGLFSRLIPSSQTASCNAIYAERKKSDIDLVHTGGENLKPLKRKSIAKSGTHLDVTFADPTFLPIPTISAETVDISQVHHHPTTSSATQIFSVPIIEVENKYIFEPETKVNFQLPANRRPSIAQIQPTLRERVKGSPRFPHRVLPITSSLGALEETGDSLRPKAGVGRMNLKRASIVGNWKSMEVPSSTRLSLTDSKDDVWKQDCITVEINQKDKEDIITVEITHVNDNDRV